MRLWNNVKTAMLLGALLGLCMFLGHMVGGPAGMMLGLVMGGGANLVMYFFSDRIALASMGARQVSRADLPWLVDMVANLAQRANLPMPRVYVCPQEAPNAFATGRNPANSAVAITEGMLRYFPRHEIEGVMAHELAHIKHRDVLISTLAAAMAGIISYVGYMLMFTGGSRDGENQNPLAAVGALVAMLVAPIAAGIIQMAISRQREYAADSYGGELCGDPRKLALALRRLESGNAQIPTETPPAFHSLYIAQPLSAGGLANLMSTHPPIQRRVALLEEQARQLAEGLVFERVR